MITPYFGEFLVSPVPLELSLNYCTHKCAYCFANLNKPDRRADLGPIMNLLKEFRERRSLPALLLQEGFPVLMSNKVDPFAASNWQPTLQLLRVMAEIGIPVAFQTKGGKGIDEALEMIGPSAFYISIGFTDDALRKKIEPGAPSIATRMELIEKLKSRGHHVCVGINPCVPQWLPDPGALLAEIQSRGVSDVWVETLHLNNNQTRNMNARERENIGAPVLREAMRRQASPQTFDYFRSIMDAAFERGMQAFTVNSPHVSTFHEVYHRLYARTFPTMQGFINQCAASKQPGDGVTFAEFRAHMMQRLPKFSGPLNDYIGAATPTMKTKYNVPRMMNFPTLLAIVWQAAESKANPQKNFAFMEEPIGKDEHGLPIYGWAGPGFQTEH
jgi:DNA repair photolyase